MPDLGELRRQIEEMAVRFVISEPDDAAWGADLKKLREAADPVRAGCVSAAVASLLSALEHPGEGGDGSNRAAQDGITRLQDALEADERVAATADLPPSRDPELLSDFVMESGEHLANIETQTLALERGAGDRESLNAVFRGFHTIKGLAGFLELWDVQELAHGVEAILDRARNGELAIEAAAIDVILAAADHLRGWLSYLDSELHGQPSQPPPRNEALLGRIRAVTETRDAEDSGAGLTRMAAAMEEPALSPNDVAAGAAEAPIAVAPAERAAEAPAAAPRPAASAEAQKTETAAVRVHTAKLDYLVDMAGEMVIAQSLVRHDPELAGIKTPRVQRNLAQLARITAELQKTAMAMRLVPVGPLFRRMERLVRDLSRQFGKRVEMETHGDDIELDRNIVEELADPLMHMVRNALDHGVETPAERERAGKSPVARVMLRGRHQAGQVVIEIADDGRGLDRQKILKKAIEKGLVTSGEGLADNEVYNLIFQPGFSTAAQVTNVSGRGVGMDVVRRHVEKLRGRIEIRSTSGRGSEFLVKLPLTLAIIEGLVVGVGAERYIAPLFAVREILRPREDTIWTVQGRAEMALIRGELLQVVRLYRRFGVTPRSEDPLQTALLVAEVEGQRFCLMVDDLIGKQEVVIKSLGPTFKQVSGIAGGAILGDGRVGLILDLERLYRERE